jgi:hypothetical protein
VIRARDDDALVRDRIIAALKFSRWKNPGERCGDNDTDHQQDERMRQAKSFGGSHSAGIEEMRRSEPPDV